MRLKITRALTGSIDGVQLSRFEPGEVYTVGTALGSYLLAVGAAEPVSDEAPAHRPLETGERRQTGWWGVRPSAAAAAADRPARKR